MISLSVCMSVYFHISETMRPSITMLPVVMALSSDDDDNATHYINSGFVDDVFTDKHREYIW